ncbi:MAG: LysR family transcriptional regulator [Carboxylicivirga sp.]|jgi:DNA-binding transcriptional LysR family regulator|nr:LysR family transcriptional regulator [Carboxylicivirga sp.]
MVNLEWFRTFKTIYEEGTLTATANKLYISQPGVSLHLSSLEAYIGEKLFDRVSKKMIPTEKGKILYNSISPSLNDLMGVERQFQRTIQSEIPTLTLGMCFETFQITLEKHMHKLDFNLVNRFSDYKQLLSELEKGITDVVITPHKSDTKGIVYKHIMTEKISLIGSKDINALELQLIIKTKDNKKILEWLMAQKWYGASSDNEHFVQFWQANFNKNPDFRQNYIVPNFLSIISSLKHGSGIAIVPDFLCNDAIANKEIQLLWQGNQKITNQIYFAYRKNSIYEEQIEQLLKLFKHQA